MLIAAEPGILIEHFDFFIFENAQMKPDMQKMVLVLCLYSFPAPSLHTLSGNDGLVRLRRYCLTCEDPNHFNRQHRAPSEDRLTIESGHHDSCASSDSLNVEDETNDKTAGQNLTSVLQEIEEEGQRLDVLGPEVEPFEWENNSKWVGTREEWTPESMERHIAGTADLDDSEAWAKLDDPLQEPDISMEVPTSERRVHLQPGSDLLLLAT